MHNGGENGEINVAHTGVVQGLYFSKREIKGTGAWESFYLAGPDATNVLVWPRMITEGANHNVIHVICPGGNATTYQGQTPALLYSRSARWRRYMEPTKCCFSRHGADYYTAINADEYTWAAPHGDILAFRVCDAFHDWIVMKSNDGGTTWNKIMVWDNPYPFFDFNVTSARYIMGARRSRCIALDNQGKVRIVCGLTRVARFPDTSAGQYTYWPFTDGVADWNEDMAPFSNAEPHDALDAWDVLEENVNNIGWVQDVDNNGTIDFVTEIMAYRSVSLPLWQPLQ